MLPPLAGEIGKNHRCCQQQEENCQFNHAAPSRRFWQITAKLSIIRCRLLALSKLTIHRRCMPPLAGEIGKNYSCRRPATGGVIVYSTMLPPSGRFWKIMAEAAWRGCCHLAGYRYLTSSRMLPFSCANWHARGACCLAEGGVISTYLLYQGSWLVYSVDRNKHLHQPL